MNKFFVSIMCVALSLPCFATTTANTQTMPKAMTMGCPQAVPTTDPNFCSSFKSVAQCHCIDSGLPASICQDVNTIYNRMISIFHSVQRACEYQRDTSTQTCIDDWNCYRLGGADSKGGLCSSTGSICP